MTTPTVVSARARPPDSSGILRPANQLARQITGRSYLSYSQVSLFRACPKKFAFQYVENAPKDFVPASLILGGSVHAALERYFQGRLEGVEVRQKDLLVVYHQAWKHQVGDAGDVPVRFGKGESVESVHALADRLLAAFAGSPLSQPKGTILGIEEELRVVLDPDLPDVLTKVDLVTQTPGALHVIDWKTSRSRWTDQKAQESSDQLVLYGVTVSPVSRSLALPVQLHFGIITKTKAPLVQVLPVPIDQKRVTVLKDAVTGVWQAIKSGNFYPSPSNQNCATCPFRSRCPVFSGC